MAYAVKGYEINPTDGINTFPVGNHLQEHTTTTPKTTIFVINCCTNGQNAVKH
jgi:hypothetical protein